MYAEIIEFAKTNNVDLLVISTHGRTGVKHLLLGSVAEQVVRQSPCPVTIVPIKSSNENEAIYLGENIPVKISSIPNTL